MAAFVGVWFRVRLKTQPGEAARYLGAYRPGEAAHVPEPLAYCYGSPGDARTQARAAGLFADDFTIEEVDRSGRLVAVAS